jgi:hypothetical protein
MKRSLLLVTLTLGVIGAAAALGAPARRAMTCAYSSPPLTWEGPEDRGPYLKAMELAAYNMIAPGDPFFGFKSLEKGTRGARASADPEIPPVLLKAISWIESVTTQASSQTPFEAVGPALQSFDCGYGIMQITSGMTTPLGEAGQPSREQALVATHFAFNIARGAVILAEKWNAAPEQRPIAGTDTGGDPKILENWYFALWSYNGFTGPGANRSNHPLDPIYGSWPRTPYSCGPANDGFGHNRGNYPYQELVIGCAEHPPVVKGKQLWQPQPISLPDLNDPRWRNPLDLANFRFPYDRMDIPSPQPTHRDSSNRPSRSDLETLIGSPKLSVDRPMIKVNYKPNQSAQSVDLTIANTGSGILPWRITATKTWVQLSATAGVALSPGVPCNGCDRSQTVKVSVDPKRAPPGETAVLRVENLVTGEKTEIALFLGTAYRIGAPGVAKN